MFPTAGVQENKGNQEVYFSSFEQLEKRLAGAHPAWLERIRREAIERFGDLGFPTPRDEDWKYTNIAPITKISFQPAAPNGLPRRELERSLAGISGPRLVFLDGRYCEEFSSLQALPHGVEAGSLAEALCSKNETLEAHLARYARYKDQAFAALNTAFLEDGAFLRVPDGAVLEEPIWIFYFSSRAGPARVSYPRNLILAGRQTQLAVVEVYSSLGPGVYLTNAVTELVAGEEAVIEHYKLQQESPESFHVGTLQVQQDRASSFSDHSVSLGSALVRNDVTVVLDGEGAECVLNGLYVAAGAQHVDNHTRIDHARPHSTSRELYKGILDGKAAGVFNGGIIVRKDAQKTDAKQSNKNLLLSEDAVINTKPQLEIWADDVKCTHGATIGQIDEEAVFYLRSRGIDRKAARNLLTYAFTNELLGRMKVEAVRGRLEGLVLARLSEAEPGN